MIEAQNLMQGLGFFYCECGDVLKPYIILDGEIIKYYCPSCDVTYRITKTKHDKGGDGDD